MRTMQGNPGAAAHDDPINKSHIRLWIKLDAAIEDIFLAPERELFAMMPGPAQVIQNPDIRPRAKGLAAHRLHEDAPDLRIALP